MPRKLMPFFCYYGGKWRSAPRYPEPKYDVIVEPFAGAAGYATRYADRNVILIDKDPTIVGLWQYLTRASVNDIMSLPVDILSSVDDLNICEEARWLIGFWCNKGSAGPGKKPSSWMKSNLRPNSYWGTAIRERIASQLEAIRHWKILEGEYSSSPTLEATWFIDPPYKVAGKHYNFTFSDYDKLAAWCKACSGQVLVCEQSGADWLPFEPFAVTKANPGKQGKSYSPEVLWTKG